MQVSESQKFLHMLKVGKDQPEMQERILAYLDANKHLSTAATLKMIAGTHWGKPQP